MRMKMMAVAVLVCGLCASGVAQTAAVTKVDPAKSMDALLSGLEKELVPLVEAMPAESYDFAPSAEFFKNLGPEYKGVRTFGQMVGHIVQANYFSFLTAEGKTMQQAPPEIMSAMQGAPKLKTKAELVQAMKDSFAFGHAAAATLTVENAWDHAGRGATDTRAGYLASAVAHGRDHYGQLVEYLRMTGKIPPASEPAKK